MLAPRTSSAFVCLRCEAQIAQRRLPAFARPQSHAKFSASARRHDDAEELAVPSQAQQPRLRIIREVTPLNRIKRKTGKLIRETSANLGVKRLGNDADILVLKEVSEPRRNKAIEKPNESEEPEEPEIIVPSEPAEIPDIVASLQEEGKAVTPEEIYEQVESLRPKNDGGLDEPHYVKQKTFVKLRKTLMTGFTQQQLTVFYSVAKNIRQEKVNQGVINSIKKKKGPGDQEHSVERSDWQPGTTAITQRLPGVDRHVKITRSRKNVSKQLLVDRILRDVWDLVLLEEIESPGELELSLQPWQLALLKAGEPEMLLDEIRRTRRVRLDVYRQHDILRITADKTTAEYAADDVEEAIQRTEMKRMNMNSYMRQIAKKDVKVNPKSDLVSLLYTQKDFDIVSMLTRTSIEAVGKNMLTIRGFDKISIDEAKRALIRFLPFKEAVARTFDTQKLGDAKKTAFLLPVLPEDNSLEYMYRKRDLGRLSMPIARLTETENVDSGAEKLAKAPKTALGGLVDRTTAAVLRSAPDVSLPTHELGHWIPEPTYKLTAEFGQVLFPLKDTDPEQAVEAALRQPSQSPFLPTVPGLNSLLNSPNLTATTRSKTPSLHYQFRPDPSHVRDQLFPSLTVQMRTGRSGARATLHKLALSFQQCAHDVLLPDKASDVRFYRRGNLYFDVKEHNDEDVQTWVNTVVENIESGGRLTAPPLRIKIPKWTIPGSPSEEEGLQSVTYHFSGIQFRQSVAGNLFGEDISYSTVQSDKFGAKGGAFKAHYDGHGDTELRDESTVKTFVERCFDMVDLITDASMQTLPVSRQLRPRDENSERKTRRKEMYASEAQAADDNVELANDLLERVGQDPHHEDDATAEENMEADEKMVEGQPADVTEESRSDDPLAERQDDNTHTP
ncbi:hypothetical protein ACET3X_004181 [Alternaria dauci]|uniref:Uncharacterized protein n=1 Tax=Alternaria dauci TaxID=48095 RepID=A0ABR3UML1_9PLEO